MAVTAERTHGGDWAAFERAYGFEPLDFSASISPLGVPDGVREAMERAAAVSDRYPDPACQALRRAIAEREGVPEAWVLCGGGAADLIWRAVFAARPRRALTPAPSFGEYEAAAEAFGCELARYRLREPFELPGSFPEAIGPGLDLLLLCNPNNPTGRTAEPSLLRQTVLRCRETGTRLLLDECFVDFLDEPERHTLRDMLGACPGLLLLRAFTKLWGMAGVRLGYALCADAAFLDAMRRAGPPWAVSVSAQAAGLAALREEGYVRRVRALVASERPRLLAGLLALGLRVVPGEANFLLFQSRTPLDAPLRERGILLRCCGDFAGLDGTWYRTSVRTQTDNDRLLAALREVLL